ncbi:MAG TPA: GNAT family N-acetyltransferase [Phycisphaerae bacterium]|nr:GNAT family N-acetyltransferase [Phycisphaerae bacterium]
MDRRPITDADRPAIADFIQQRWRSKKVMSRGKPYYPHEHDGFIEWREEKIVGLLTLRCQGDQMELLTLNSMLEGQGIGSALMLMAIEKARELNLSKVWVTTTNDALRGIGFYQRLGFRITQVNVGAVDEARKIKPEIPESGEGGIPIHDEIVLELKIQPSLNSGPGLCGQL